jgi:hypothetical protein
VPPADHDLDELIDALDAAAGEASFLVCADALLGAGEAQGQAIALHLRGLRDRAVELQLEQLVRKAIGEPWFEEDHGVELDWSRGFISAVRWSGWHGFERIGRQLAELAALTQCAPALAPALPWREERRRAHRLLRRLETLHVGPWDSWPRYDALWQALARTGLPPSVRALIVSDVPHPRRDEHQITWIDLGDLGQANEALQQLERLSIRGSYLRLGRVDLPRLKHFTVVTSTFDELGALRSARWPALETLSIAFGDDEYNPNPVTFDEVVAWLREIPAKVTHLGVRNVSFTDELISVLAASPMLGRLRELDLSFGVLLERGAELLHRHAEAFAHLAVLDVTDTGLTDFDALKKKVPGLHRATEWRTKNDRYVSIRE